MADEEKDPEQDGPLLLMLADVLAKPPRVYASPMLGRNIQVKGIVYAVLFAALGFVLGIPFKLILGTWLISYWGAALVGALGVFIANTTPLKGEKVGTWLRLLAGSYVGRVDMDGERCKLYLDVAPITELEIGDYLIQSATVPVDPGLVDRRGTFID